MQVTIWLAGKFGSDNVWREWMDIDFDENKFGHRSLYNLWFDELIIAGPEFY